MIPAPSSRQHMVIADAVADDHPMLAGHFPGHPIVPGAWLLAWVVAAARERCEIEGVKRVKFLRPLAPGRAFQCALRGNADAIRFTVTSDDAVIAEGVLQSPAA